DRRAAAALRPGFGPGQPVRSRHLRRECGRALPRRAEHGRIVGRPGGGRRGLDRAARKQRRKGKGKPMTRSVRRIAVGLILCAAAAARAEEPTTARIAGAAMTGGSATAFLQRLTDEVGGRVTGSPQTRAASDLILT